MSRNSLKRRLLRRPSPALVVSMIALVVASTGVASGGIGGSKSAPTAAARPFTTGAHVLVNSPKSAPTAAARPFTTGAHVLDHSLKLGPSAAAAGPFITGAHVLDNSLTGADINQATLTAVANAAHANSADTATNAGHATSADSAASATNATNATHASVADSATTASSASAPGTLGSGRTEIGTLYVIAPQGSGAGFIGQQISFPFPVASVPVAHYIPSGTTAQCPGTSVAPTAASGHLCVYQISRSGGSTPGFEDVGKYGAGLFNATSAGSGYEYLTARWAVTG